VVNLLIIIISPSKQEASLPVNIKKISLCTKPPHTIHFHKPKLFPFPSPSPIHNTAGGA
jgi:hypothetical protein